MKDEKRIRDAIKIERTEKSWEDIRSVQYSPEEIFDYSIREINRILRDLKKYSALETRQAAEKAYLAVKVTVEDLIKAVFGVDVTEYQKQKLLLEAIWNGMTEEERKIPRRNLASWYISLTNILHGRYFYRGDLPSDPREVESMFVDARDFMETLKQIVVTENLSRRAQDAYWQILLSIVLNGGKIDNLVIKWGKTPAWYRKYLYLARKNIPADEKIRLLREFVKRTERSRKRRSER